MGIPSAAAMMLIPLYQHCSHYINYEIIEYNSGGDTLFVGILDSSGYGRHVRT
jgi:hypothetical protein